MRVTLASARSLQAIKQSKTELRQCPRLLLSGYRRGYSDFCVSEHRRASLFSLARAHSWYPFNAMPDDNKLRELVGARPAKKRRHGIYAGLYYQAGCSQLLGVAFYNVTTDISSLRRVPRVIRSYVATMGASLALV